MKTIDLDGRTFNILLIEFSTLSNRSKNPVQNAFLVLSLLTSDLTIIYKAQAEKASDFVEQSLISCSKEEKYRERMKKLILIDSITNKKCNLTSWTTFLDIQTKYLEDVPNENITIIEI